jgi:hypothetical protein
MIPKFNTPLYRIDPEYILGIVEQVYGLRVQQIHIPTYKKHYPDYIDRMCPYPRKFRFPDFM